MAHDPRLVSDDKIEELKKAVPDWVKRLERPATPCIVPAFGPRYPSRPKDFCHSKSAPV